ncbi:MAG: tripartite tricarboxylate transporter TctB family protein [Burkholderiales bacterium]
MKLHDSLIGAGLMILAAFIYWNTRGFPSMPGDPVGPALFPQFIALGLGIAGLVLTVGALRRKAGGPWYVVPEWVRTPRQLSAFVIVAGGLFGYYLLVEKIGFFICAPLLLGAMLVVLRVRRWAVPIIAIGVTLVIHAIFYKGLGVPLPWGLLQDWAW